MTSDLQGIRTVLEPVFRNLDARILYDVPELLGYFDVRVLLFSNVLSSEGTKFWGPSEVAHFLHWQTKCKILTY